MVQNEIDNYIQDLVVAITQQQGLHFNSLKEANAHNKKTTLEIRQLLKQSSVVLKEGLNILSKKSTGFVADISKKLLTHLHTPEKIAQIMDAEINENAEALKQFSAAVNSFYDCGDYHLEQCVLSVFLMLFPLYPQPYACYATMLWRKEGIDAAVTFYEPLVDAIEDPILDYYAADCLVKAGKKSRAKELLQRAFTQLVSSPEDQVELRQHIVALLKQCE